MAQICNSSEDLLREFNITPESTKICVHKFSEKLLDHVVHFQIISLENSFFIWIGKEPVLQNLSVAVIGNKTISIHKVQ